MTENQPEQVQPVKPQANGTNGLGYSMGPKQIVLRGQLIGHKRILNVENDSRQIAI